jgi:hypothetical protein
MSKQQKDYFEEAATRELFVGNLPKGMNDVFKTLDGFCYFQPDREGRPYGFIGFKTAEQCSAALEELTGKEYNRRIIEVKRPNSYKPPKITKQHKKIQQKIATEKWEQEEKLLENYEKQQKIYNEQSEALKYFEEQKQQLREREQLEKDLKIAELQQKLEYYQMREQQEQQQQLRERDQQMRKRELEQLREREQQQQLRKRELEQQQMRELEQQKMRERELEQHLIRERDREQQQMRERELIYEREQIEKQKLIEQLLKFNYEVVTADQYSLIQRISFEPETESEKNVYFALKDMRGLNRMQNGSTAEILYNVLYNKYRHYNLLGI